MKVYLLYEKANDGHDWEVVGVYSSKDLAEKKESEHAKRYHSTRFWIEEVEVDK